MIIHWRLFWRRSHRWGAILVAVPFLIVILSGIFLQLKKESNWIQPATKRGQGKIPSISFAAILDAVRSRPEAGISDWKDVERLDVQPSRGVAKVQGVNRWEVQVDMSSGEVLQVAYRRSDLIESLHDGSWFHERAKLFIFLPTAIIVLGLWGTGIYLFFMPIFARWSKRRNRSSHSSIPKSE